MRSLEDLALNAWVGEVKSYTKGFPFYEIKKDGIYIGKFNGCMLARKKLLEYKEGNFPLAAEGKEGFELKIPKIPFKYWEMIWSFYNDVNKKYGTEATVLLYWNDKGDLNIPEDINREYGKGLYEDGKLILYVPKQKNYKSLTEYHGDKMRVWLGNNTSNLLDTHSHNEMNAFFSYIDDENEKNFQFYSVFGRVGTNNTCIMRYRFQDTWNHIDVFDVFEEGTIQEGDKNTIKYPEVWLEQCEFIGNERGTCNDRD